MNKKEKGSEVWKGWETTKDGDFRKYYGKKKYIDVIHGFFHAYDGEEHYLGGFWTLKEAEEVLGKKK
jgi:hypothetical protein